MKKKICYCIKQFGFIPPPYGGVSIFIKRLNEKLNLNGISSSSYYITKKNYENENRESKILDSKLPDLRLKSLPYVIIKLFFDFKEYRIIHSHLGFEGLIHLWFIKKLQNKIIIVTIHDLMVFDKYIKMPTIKRYFIKKMINEKDIVWIAVSKEIKEKMVSINSKFINMEIIPAYIPIIQKGEPENFLPRNLIDFILSKKTIIVIYGYSFMNHEKADVYGYNLALDALNYLMDLGIKDCGLIVCVDSEQNDPNLLVLKNKAISTNIDKNIYWQTSPLQEMWALWKKTNIYIRPTATDGDSVAIREALDFGVTVIASDVVERPKGTIYYKYGDQKSFCLKILKNLGNTKMSITPNYEYYLKMEEIYKKYL